MVSLFSTMGPGLRWDACIDAVPPGTVIPAQARIHDDLRGSIKMSAAKQRGRWQGGPNAACSILKGPLSRSVCFSCD